ncbi:MAG: hypothetical protein ETSY2_21720 [Candidatus Entotheonella gemina]|uniref:Uncharacterized protein n=1 Tax=Candidatus Entotheonella gemina TaxID=1429439 RepID=W4M7M6_9BACT|nr:MAG: hypothetical protein ETSY2_21720 [Candidatus Entotheonella gemina]
MSIEVKNYLEVKMQWEQGRDPIYPYEGELEGAKCRIRLNDFPVESLYTLIVDDKEITSFDDWPQNWTRP